MSGQAVRDRLVPAFLDVSLAQWLGFARSLTAAELAALERDGWDVYVARIIEALDGTAEHDPTARGDYLQVMAQLADDTMRELVRRVTGGDPLDGEVPAGPALGVGTSAPAPARRRATRSTSRSAASTNRPRTSRTSTSTSLR